jgi:hypothetical protein
MNGERKGRRAAAETDTPERSGATISWRDLLVYGSRLLPAIVALILIFLALRPMLFSPAEKLTGTLASMVGVGLSFASVSFSAANAHGRRSDWSRRMVAAGLMLMRFALALVVALALATARGRVVEDFGYGNWLDFTLRGLMAIVTGAGIFAAFRGFRELILLLVPWRTEEPAEERSEGFPL